MQAYCELIIYTYLPKEIWEDLLDKLPELKNIFSFALCKEDAVVYDKFLIKDIGVLLGSRKIEDIVIIDVDPTKVD